MPTVLLEDNHCLAVDKPAGLLAQGDATGDPSLVDWATDYLRAKYQKHGNVYVGLVHRLDRPTSGVVLLARTSKAAGRLAEQFRTSAVAKTYLAVCHDSAPGPIAAEGVWVDYVLKDARTNHVAVVLKGGGPSQRAETGYRVVFRDEGLVGVVLEPRTGRGHQLRVQLASRGWPILGDLKYGAKSRLPAAEGGTRIALHAASLAFKHPTRGETCVVRAPLPSDWPDVARAWETAWPDSSTPEELPGR